MNILKKHFDFVVRNGFGFNSQFKKTKQNKTAEEKMWQKHQDRAAIVTEYCQAVSVNLSGINDLILVTKKWQK